MSDVKQYTVEEHIHLSGFPGGNPKFWQFKQDLAAECAADLPCLVDANNETIEGVLIFDDVIRAGTASTARYGQVWAEFKEHGAAVRFINDLNAWLTREAGRVPVADHEKAEAWDEHEREGEGIEKYLYGHGGCKDE